jgi:enoyl-CoA hydratase
MSATPSADTLIRIEGAAGRITLNRPQALNALTYEQVLAIAAALAAWREDPAVDLVLLDGAGERALCAGGDVRAMYDSAADGPAFARRFWRDEYRLNADIAAYPKPVIAVMDGIVMGGGIGLAGHASHRIVTERSSVAFPETSIGLIPDVGGSWLLANAPGRTGLYLGLVGYRMTAADALYARFADAAVPTDRLGELKRELAVSKHRRGTTAGEVIRAAATDPGRSVLEERRAAIDRLMAADGLEGIAAALAASDLEWARAAAGDLKSRSPLALALTLKAIRDARRLPSLAAALDVEYRLTTRLFEDGEFIEGVRALIVDKDRRPRWIKTTLTDVTPEVVAGYFAPLAPAAELGLGQSMER